MYTGPNIDSSGLVFAVDAGSERSYPSRGIATTWVDYANNQANYTLLGDDGIYIKNTYANWIGYFPATVVTVGSYTVQFDYIADASSVLVLDNDGIHDNTYNVNLNATTSTQSHTGTVNITTTGDIKFYLRRNSGGNITVTNFRYFKSDIWNDLSSNENNGTLVNGVVFSTSNSGTLTFDGTDDYINLNNAVLIDPSQGTFTGWVKLAASNNNHAGIFTSQTGPSWAAMRFVVNIYPPNKIRFVISDGSSATNDSCVSNTALSYNEWYYIACTYDGTSMKIYLNGVLDDTFTTTKVPGTYTPNATMIGSQNYSNRYFNGAINIVKIYNTVLTATEVGQNYNAYKNRF